MRNSLLIVFAIILLNPKQAHSQNTTGSKIDPPIDVTIGKQVWMKRNLNVDKFRNGDVIPYAGTSEEWALAEKNKQPAWCYYDMVKYGKLYNWYAVNDSRGLAPIGWRIPSNEDWITLMDYLGGGMVAGGKMKSVGTKYWKGWEIEKKGLISRNLYATDESHFSGLPGGSRTTYFLQGVGRDAAWWSSSQYDSYDATYLSLNHLSGELHRGRERKSIGFSVRCLSESSNEVYIIDLPKSNEVMIGKQIWMSKNLTVDKFKNGDMIPYAETEEDWIRARDNGEPAWCYYDNNTVKGKIYGKLYNWYAVNDPRGLAPDGWHIPSDNEWEILSNYLGGELLAGEMLKSRSSSWLDNGNGSNLSGFTALPAGFRYEYGTFNDIGVYGIWWSTTEEEVVGNNAWCRTLSKSTNTLSRYEGDKDNGYSVRCIKNNKFNN